MGVKREYTVAQALAMINRSEGCLVRDSKVRLATHDEPGAHSLGRHLVSAGTIGGRASGPQAGFAFVRDRFLVAPGNVSSAWYRKGDMAIRLAEALNSEIGQHALEAMGDLGLSRVAIHYVNRNVMTNGGDLFNPAHMSVDYTVTADQTVMTPFDIINKKTGAYIKTIQKQTTIKGSTTPNVAGKQVVGIHCVLDQHSRSELHLQTLFPSFELAEDSYDYNVGMVGWTVIRTSSGFRKKFKAR